MADNKRSKIEAIWEEPETPTYITDPEYLADITSDREDSVIEDLLEKAEAIKNEAKGNGIKIIETYFGKTYIGEVEEGFDRTNPDTWNFEGIKSRFTSHKTPKDIIAQRNMIILTTVIMDDSVPDEIKQEYDRLKLEDPKTPASKPATQINVTNTTPTKEPRSQRDKSATPERGIVSPPPPKKKTKATCPAEFYALEIERTLFSQYMESAAEQRDTEGRTGKHDGYVVYMRITHSEREEVCVKNNNNETNGEYKVSMTMQITKLKEDDEEQEFVGLFENLSLEGSGAQREMSQKLKEVKVTAGRLLEQMKETIEAFDDAYISMTIKLAELKKKIEQLQS